MSWAYLDDQIAFHRKVIAAGNEAFGAWIRMIAHSCAYDTKGVVEKKVALSIGSTRLVKRLVEVVLLEPFGEHYRIHDFDDWQTPRPREPRNNLSEKRAEAGRKGAEARWAGHSKQDGKPDSKAMANDGNLPMANDAVPMAPSPSPKRERDPISPKLQDRHSAGPGPASGGAQSFSIPEEPESTTLVSAAPSRGPVAASADRLEAERQRQLAAAEDWERKNGSKAG